MRSILVLPRCWPRLLCGNLIYPMTCKRHWKMSWGQRKDRQPHWTILGQSIIVSIFIACCNYVVTHHWLLCLTLFMIAMRKGNIENQAWGSLLRINQLINFWPCSRRCKVRRCLSCIYMHNTVLPACFIDTSWLIWRLVQNVAAYSMCI